MKTMKITVDVPEVVEFASRGVEFVFRVGDVPAEKRAEFVAQAFAAGIAKAGVDAASNAASHASEHKMTVEAATRELVEKRLEVWKRGEWTAHAVGVRGFNADVLAICKDQLKAAIGEKAWKRVAQSDQTTQAREYFAGLDDAAQGAIIAAAEERRKAREAFQATLRAIKVDVPLPNPAKNK